MPFAQTMFDEITGGYFPHAVFITHQFDLYSAEF
jgi:hypothetical protein